MASSKRPIRCSFMMPIPMAPPAIVTPGAPTAKDKAAAVAEILGVPNDPLTICEAVLALLRDLKNETYLASRRALARRKKAGGA